MFNYPGSIDIQQFWFHEYSTIVPFHNDISPSGEQPEHRILACEL